MIQPTNAQQTYPQGGANAVSINIFNPQAYGSAPQQQTTNTSNTAPYDYTNSVYNMPQASVYQPDQQGVATAQYPQYLPQAQTLPVAPQAQAPEQAQVPTPPAVAPVAAPAPEIMPQSVMEQAQAPQAPEQAQVPQQTEQVQAPQANQAETPEAEKIDTEVLVSDLKSDDNEKKAGAIDKIAEYVQGKPEVALQVVSEPIMQALTSIINEDTSSLQGPSEEQIKIAQKVAKGEKLTEEEDKLSEQLSPRDMANKTRIFALYTLAMIQKLQRDELDQYIETQKQNGEQPIEPLKLNDLIGYQDIVNTIKKDSRPEVQIAAIQALKYIVKPEDEATVKEVLNDSLKSNDKDVKAAAQEVVDMYKK